MLFDSVRGEETFSPECDLMEQIQALPLDQIQTTSQVRTHFDEEAIQGLALSFKEVGQLQPIRVRRDGDRFVIVDGERRYRAFLTNGQTAINAIIEEQELGEGDLLQRQLIANCQREDLSPVEKARALKQLMTVTGWNAKQTATSLGMSRAMATRLLSLLNLPAELQHKIERGEIAASAAYELARIGDADQQAELSQQLSNGQLTRDGLAGTLKAARNTCPGATVPQIRKNSSRVTAQLGNGWALTMTGTALDLESFISALEELLAKARRVRPQGVALKTFVKMLKDQVSEEGRQAR